MTVVLVKEIKQNNDKKRMRPAGLQEASDSKVHAEKRMELDECMMQMVVCTTDLMMVQTCEVFPSSTYDEYSS